MCSFAYFGQSGGSVCTHLYTSVSFWLILCAIWICGYILTIIVLLFYLGTLLAMISMWYSNCLLWKLWVSLPVGSNGKRAPRNFASCGWTLVYWEKRSDNSLIYTLKGTFSFLYRIFVCHNLKHLSLRLPFQAIVLDQGFEADILADIQKYLEELITGLRQRFISLIKVSTSESSSFHFFVWFELDLPFLFLWRVYMPSPLSPNVFIC